MSAPPPPPPGLDIHASRQASLYAATITTWVLAVAAVGLRFWCRKLTKSGYKIDDWFVVAATLFALGFLISTLVWVRQGYGLHLWVLGPEFVADFFKNLYTGEILYTLVLCFAKFSILAFYRRIFAREIRTPVYILAGFVTAWGIAVILVTIFQCNPVSGFWNRTKPAKCAVDDYAFFIGNAVPNIITDAAILSLPLPFIFRLHRILSQKIALAGIFMLGGFIIIISILRLVILVRLDLKSPDIDWNFAFVGVWTATEGNMAIVCACLPSLRPILSMIMTGSPNLSHYLKNHSGGRYTPSLFAKRAKKSQNSTSYGSQGDAIGANESQRGFVHLPGEPAQSKAFAARAEATSLPLESGFGEDIEMQGVTKTNTGIHVRNDMSVDYTAGSR